MSRGLLVIIGIGMVAVLLSLVGVERAHRSSGQPGATGVNVKDNSAPDFTLQSLDGKTTRLSSFRGKAVLLNFWATWCAPCRIEIPWFVELQNRYGSERLQVLGVAMDDANSNDIGKFAKEQCFRRSFSIR